MADFQIVSAVICDDIRREVNQKDILIGVYGADIIVSNLPFQIGLAFWMEFTTKKTDSVDVFVKIEAPNHQKSFEFSVNIEINEKQDSYVISIPPIQILVENPGKIRLLVKSKKELKYDIVKTKNFVYKTNSQIK